MPGESVIDIGGGVQFLNSETRQFLAHRDHHNFWIHDCSFILCCYIFVIASKAK